MVGVDRILESVRISPLFCFSRLSYCQGISEVAPESPVSSAQMNASHHTSKYDHILVDPGVRVLPRFWKSI